MALRVLIVDDNSQFLEAASDLLQREGLEVVGLASTGAEAARLAEELEPDVTLVDIDLGEESGFDVARALIEHRTDEPVRVVLVSTYAEKDFADLIGGSPAVGFVSKADLSARRLREVLGDS